MSSACLCFSVGSTELDASCKVMVSFSSDSCCIFLFASAVESSPCSFSCSSKHSSSFCCCFNSSCRLSISWSLFRESNFAFSFAVSIAARFEEEVEDDRTDDGGFLECCDLCERSSTLSISWSFIPTLMSAKHCNAASFNLTYWSCSLCSLSSSPNLISRSIKFSCTVLNLSSAACKPSLQVLPDLLVLVRIHRLHLCGIVNLSFYRFLGQILSFFRCSFSCDVPIVLRILSYRRGCFL